MIKSTGIVRRVDELGRIVIPSEIRAVLEIDSKDSLEIFTDEDKIILKKYQPSCIFCGSASDVNNVMGKRVCVNCIKEISNLQK